MQGGIVQPPNENEKLIRCGARSILSAFDRYQTAFAEITRRARTRFVNQDWQAGQQDARERLDLYGVIVNQIVEELSSHILVDICKDRRIWMGMRVEYSELAATRIDLELAETFFNSVSRRIFTTIGVDTSIEFVDQNFDEHPAGSTVRIFTTHRLNNNLPGVIREILESYSFEYEQLDRDVNNILEVLLAEFESGGEPPNIAAIDMLDSVFFRNKGAYLVGRIHLPGYIRPFVLALLNHGGYIFVDAVLLTNDEVSIVFSYTRSYFHVDIGVPHELVRFLHTILPNKRIAEIYISIGYNKHGKTELFRDLLRHLSDTDDQFDIAPGEKGMVMLVFTMPSFDMVFKMIRDKFAEPKTTTRSDVMRSYQLVFKHDRAGRLVDAQEFEYLAFDLERFTPALLSEMKQQAAESIQIKDGRLVVKHLYTERRMTPLDVFVRSGEQGAVNEAILDYGQAIKDLAATNIFPGDILLKNFGVTRHGRVVFYDYDELTLLTECVFRKFPQPNSDSEYMEAEPWFFVGKNDIFPEEFETFLGLPAPYRAVFKSTHADLFGTDFWRKMQKRHRAGEVLDIYPYKPSKRLLGDRNL